MTSGDAHGVLFTADSVQAIEANEKTQTRRLLTLGTTLVDGVRARRGHQFTWHFASAWVDPGPSPAGNDGPYLKVPRSESGVDEWPAGGTVHRLYPIHYVGRRWYVKETWGSPAADHPRVKDGRRPQFGDPLVYRAKAADAAQWDTDDPRVSGSFGWRSPLLMPRWAARYFLEVTRVRIERLQSISWDDAVAEGMTDDAMTRVGFSTSGDKRQAYGWQWDRLHADPDTRWSDNPWVIVYDFKRVNAPQVIDLMAALKESLAETSAT